jgi:GTP cyclohydrolase I
MGEKCCMKSVQPEALEQMASHMKQVLELLGFDTSSEGLLDTPMRFSKYLAEFCHEYDYGALLHTFSADGSHSMVVQENIPFRMACEHHLVPAMGRAAFGYIPDKKVVGLSKITRLIQAVGTERPSLQEYIGERVADLFCKYLEPKGCIVVITAEHGCMACRGIKAPGVSTTTSTVRGVFRDVPACRAEFLNLISRPHSC